MQVEPFGESFHRRMVAGLRAAARTHVGVAQRLRSAGVAPSDDLTLERLNRVPVMTKDEFARLQEEDPPFAGLVSEEASVQRVFQSPGPIYLGDVEGQDLGRWETAFRRSGFVSRDRVLNALSYHLTPAGALFERGARKVGCLVVPAGVGSQSAQLRAMRDLSVNGYVGLPSYLSSLLDRSRMEGPTEGGTRGIRLDRALVTGEAMSPELRERLSEQIGDVRQTYGTAECGHLATECADGGSFHLTHDAIVQICRVEDGLPVDGDEVGQVVVTVLRSEQPLVRFGTGDLSRWLGPCACGDPTPSIAGVVGRVGDAVKVRGLFVHPRQIRSTMAARSDVAGYRILISREAGRDRMICTISPQTGVDPERVRADVAQELRSHLRLNVEVQVSQEALTAFDGAIQDLRD